MLVFDTALKEVGDFGKYQKCLLGFVFYTTFMCGVNYYTQIFIFTAAPHECEDEPDFACDSNSTTTRCRSWKYDHGQIFPTIASENDWVCHKDDLPAKLQQAFWSGNAAGCFLWGYMNDHAGRRPTVLVTHLVYIVGNALTFVAPNFWSLAACRFLVGAAHHTVSHLPYLITLEYCGVERRTIPLLMMMSSYTAASLTIPFLTRVLPSWRYLLLLATLPNGLIVALYKFVPESPSWLMCRGHFVAAKRALKVVAKVNGRRNQNTIGTLDAILKQDIHVETHVAAGKAERRRFATLFEYLKLPRLVFRSVLVVVVCIVAFMCYYGQAENTKNLGGDLAWSFFFAAAVEIPAYSVPFLANVTLIGRKGVLLITSLATSAASVFYGYYPLLPVALLGRMFATGAYYISLQFASEVLPTVIRGAGLAACEIFGGIGLFICPLIVYLGRQGRPHVPLLIFGVLSFLGAICSLLLPETCHKTLPHTLEDGDRFGRDEEPPLCCRSFNSRATRRRNSNNGIDEVVSSSL